MTDYKDRLNELTAELRLVERKLKRSEESRVLIENLKDRSDMLYEKVLNDLQKNKKELHKTIVELKKQKNEKENLLREIHHRVKNNLQIVNTLLNFQAREFNDPVVLSKFEATQNRISTIANLHEKMYNSQDLVHINIKNHFQELASELIDLYSIGKNIKLNIEIAPEIEFGMKTIVPLGLLINEVITNSCKYGFANQKEGELKLFLHQQEGEKYVLTIGDNGAGFDEEKINKSLGSKLIEAFTEQLEGNIKRLDINGSVYELTFKSID